MMLSDVTEPRSAFCPVQSLLSDGEKLLIAMHSDWVTKAACKLGLTKTLNMWTQRSPNADKLQEEQTNESASEIPTALEICPHPNVRLRSIMDKQGNLREGRTGPGSVHSSYFANNTQNSTEIWSWLSEQKSCFHPSSDEPLVCTDFFREGL